MSNVISHVHAVLDLETLAVSPNAHILSIGVATTVGKNFYVELPALSQHGEIQSETVEWWEKQSENARQLAQIHNAVLRTEQPDSAYRAGRESLLLSLSRFCEFIEDVQQEAKNAGAEFYFWGNSPSFDQLILSQLLRRMGYSQPWDFRDEVCFRTFRRVHGLPRPAPKIPHHAYEDAFAELAVITAAQIR